jgi:transglutaminase-like putative cysteine protease
VQFTLNIRIGYELVFDCPKPTPMILTLNVHASRAADLQAPDLIQTFPPVPMTAYHDSYGNWCTRITAPQGQLRVTTDAVIRDSGLPDEVAPTARQHAVQELPTDSLLYLLGSRYCETDLLGNIAWDLFGHLPAGWSLVQAICDFVHQHIKFGYEHARATKTALQVYQDRVGVCRDYTHLAIAFCRCLNIPTRYCMGYLSDIDMPPPYGTPDFAAWLEVYLEDRWYVFDARNNKPYIGRILIARGRDAADVAISNSFGPNTLSGFKVWTDELEEIL